MSGQKRVQERDLGIYLPNHDLLYTDKRSMALGVEARVPFLDIEVVNQVIRYPNEWHLAEGQTKVLLREASKGIVPDEIIQRPKVGFGAPPIGSGCETSSLTSGMT